jgi:hypothetical protein
LQFERLEDEFFTPVEHFAWIDRASRIISGKIISESAAFTSTCPQDNFVAVNPPTFVVFCKETTA